MQYLSHQLKLNIYACLLLNDLGYSFPRVNVGFLSIELLYYLLDDAFCMLLSISLRE